METSIKQRKAYEFIKKEGLFDKWLHGKVRVIPFAQRHGFKWVGDCHGRVLEAN